MSLWIWRCHCIKAGPHLHSRLHLHLLLHWLVNIGSRRASTRRGTKGYGREISRCDDHVSWSQADSSCLPEETSNVERSEPKSRMTRSGAKGGWRRTRLTHQASNLLTFCSRGTTPGASPTPPTCGLIIVAGAGPLSRPPPPAPSRSQAPIGQGC